MPNKAKFTKITQLRLRPETWDYAATQATGYIGTEIRRLTELGVVYDKMLKEKK